METCADLTLNSLIIGLIAGVLAFIFGGIGWWLLRGVLLGFLLDIKLRRFIVNYSIEYILSSRIKWDTWLLRQQELDCVMEVRSLLGYEVLGFDSLRIPFKGTHMEVEAGSFQWKVVSKNRGEQRFFFHPVPATVGVSAYQPRNGMWYLMDISMSWNGLPIFRNRYEVGSFGTGVQESSFYVRPYFA